MVDKSHQRIHVLIAVNDYFQIRALQHLMALCDYEVTAVGNGRLARDELLKADLNIDIVLSSYYMPEMDGLDLLLFMQGHENLKRIPFIMMSANDDQERRAQCIQNGAQEYLIKPLRLQNIQGLAKYVECNLGNKNIVETPSNNI